MTCRTPKRDAGFTLLEVLVALTVLSVILVLLSQGVQFGLRTTLVQAEFRQRHADVETIDRTLRRLIAQADPGIYPTPPTLQGTASTLSFTSTLPAAAAGPGQLADIVLGVQNGRLVMRWQARRHVDTFAAPAPPETTVLLDGIDRAEFAYSAGGAWSDTWTAERLPALIRVTLLFPDGGRTRWPPIIAVPMREAMEQ